ncbi:ABC transporter substrate-binding protein [Halobacteriovorax marinus]|uniref:ABC transporter substrate-binding protein n=1 Tax=Halobacteriovorax marinus TaxID=97084 RepID=UPI003A8E3F6B
MNLAKVLLLIFTISLFSCKKKDDSNTLNVSISGEISTLDPANSYDTISASIVYQGYEPLYEYHYLKRPYTIQPLLAEAMPIIEDNGRKYTIKIKKNIQYHDDPAFKGKARFVKAEDFINQIKRLAYLPTNSNGWWLFDQKIKGLNDFRNSVGRDFEKFKTTKIEGLKAIDDHTLVIELNESYPQMLYTLAMSFTSPMPIEAIEMYENNLNDKIIGTGPFKLDSWTSSTKLRLIKNENYRKAFYPGQGDRIANSRNLLRDSGKVIPFIDKVEYNVYKEAQTRWLNFKAKKIDFLIIPKDNYSSAVDPNGNLTKELQEENIKLQIFPTLTYWWLSFNMQDPLLGKNLNLRKAIAHAIDVERYIKVFTNNIGQKSNSIYPPGIPGYDPSAQLPYEYNLEKAREFLKKAGYPNGKGLPTLTYDVRGVSATNRQQADFVKSELGKIGINVQVALNNFPAFLEKARQGKLQFWQDGWALDYPDSENVLQLLISKNHAPGPNSTFYSNKEFDKLFNKLKVMPNGPEKIEVMKRMEEIIIHDLPWVMQYYSRNYILYHDRLNNYRHSDLIYNNFKYLRLNQK